MTTSGERRLLMLATDARAGGGDGAGGGRGGGEWVCVAGPGEALRRVNATRPRVVVVRIDQLEEADAASEVLEALRRRWPRLALVAVSPIADERVERCVRAAGAHCYLHDEADAARVGELLAAILPTGPPAGADPPSWRRPPPEARAHGPPAGRLFT